MDESMTDTDPQAREFRPLDTMTVAELLEAISLNSDQATYLWSVARHKAETSDEQERIESDANDRFDRRNDAMREVQRRFDTITRRGAVTIPLDVARLVDSALWFGVHDEKWTETERDERYDAGCTLQEAIAATDPEEET